MSPITSSTTERVFEYGALKTAMPFLPAYSRSTWLVPMQKQPTAVSVGRASMTLRVTLVLERINQLVLAQGSLEALDLEAMVAQRLRRVGMDVFK